MSVSFMANAQEYPRGDVSQDGAVDIADVTDLINYLLTGTWPDEPVTEGDWVDLGLPSGTLWATRNVGVRLNPKRSIPGPLTSGLIMTMKVICASTTKN